MITSVQIISKGMTIEFIKKINCNNKTNSIKSY